MVANTLP